MHPYKSLVVLAIDSGPKPFISMSLRNGDSAEMSCTAEKRFPMEEWGEVRDILGWASHAFLSAADQLAEDGWEIRHMPNCTDAHLAVADA